MKRASKVMAVVAFLLVAGFFAYIISVPRPVSGRVNALKIMTAAQTYAHDLKAHGLAVPATVALQDLIAQGLLTTADVSGFAGMDVTVSLVHADRSPQEVLMRVRLQDGSQIVALEDGSVQQVPR